MYYGYNISDFTADLAIRAEADCKEIFAKIENEVALSTDVTLLSFHNKKIILKEYCYPKNGIGKSIVEYLKAEIGR